MFFSISKLFSEVASFFSNCHCLGFWFLLSRCSPSFFFPHFLLEIFDSIFSTLLCATPFLCLLLFFTLAGASGPFLFAHYVCFRFCCREMAFIPFSSALSKYTFLFPFRFCLEAPLSQPARLFLFKPHACNFHEGLLQCFSLALLSPPDVLTVTFFFSVASFFC